MYFLFQCEISFLYIEIPKKLYKEGYFIDKSEKSRLFTVFCAQKTVSLAVCDKRVRFFCDAVKKHYLCTQQKISTFLITKS